MGTELVARRVVVVCDEGEDVEASVDAVVVDGLVVAVDDADSFLCDVATTRMTVMSAATSAAAASATAVRFCDG